MIRYHYNFQLITVLIVANKFKNVKKPTHSIKVSLLLHLRSLKGKALNIYGSDTSSRVLYVCDMKCHFYPSNMSKNLFEKSLW